MYFNEYEHRFVPTLDTAEIEGALGRIAEELREDRDRYHAFGPYWWTVKDALRTRVRRRDWFTGPARDPDILDRPAQAASSEEYSQRELAEALYYFSQESADGDPLPEIHLLELGGTARIYRLQDPDASRQLDLFEEEVNQERRREEFLKRTANFLPGPWLQKGDTIGADGVIHRAVACYKRALVVAHDEESRLQSWLRIGTTLHEAGHPNKAILAFEQAYRRGQEGWILGLIGQACLSAERYGEAAEQFRGALASMPGNPEYQAGLAAAQERLNAQDRELAIG